MISITAGEFDNCKLQMQSVTCIAMYIKSHRNHAATEFCVINTSVRYAALHSPRNSIPYPSKLLVDVLITHISCRLPVQGQGINSMQL
jgi:hypothetical protein